MYQGTNEDRTMKHGKMKHSTTDLTTMEDKLNEDNLNDASLYGEFISTFHHWVSSEDLHAKGEYLQQIGKTQ